MNATRQHLILATIFLSAFLAVFWRALIGAESFAFRDAAHFYPPLFKSIQDDWWAGRLPLWDPLENVGMPLAGSGTASAFYPGKVVYFLLPPDLAYRLYVTGHVVLAGWTVYRLARYWRLRAEAATLAAIVYAFSGSILYQYCNVVFLVGAAWLPMAVLEADRLARRRSAGAVARLGAVWALMILGGDPQTAYHAAILAVTLVFWRKGRRRPSQPTTSHSPRKSRFALLTAAAAVAASLSAVQLLPLREFTQHSERAIVGPPQNLYQMTRAWLASTSAPSHVDTPMDADTSVDWDGVLVRNFGRNHHARIAYDFSVGPWRLAELVWPNIGGRQFPIHTRWLAAIPAEGRVWVPSLYFGVVPLILALCSMQWRPRRGVCRRSTVVWLTYTTAFGVLAALGGFGPVWLAREVAGWFRVPFPAPESIGGPVGGVYWALNLLMPLYAGFRYPAKWWTVATLGFGLLAGVGLDRQITSARFGDALQRLQVKRGAAVAGALAVASLLAAVTLTCYYPRWVEWGKSVPADAMFGPYSAEVGFIIVRWGLLQTACVAAVFGLWLVWNPRAREWSGLFLAAVVAVDLAFANGWMIATTPPQTGRLDSPIAAAVAAERRDRSAHPPRRVYRHHLWYPTAWREEGSATRLAESVAWDRATLWPKYSREQGIAVTEVHGTMMPADYYIFLRCLRAYRPLNAAGLRIMGAEAAILPEGAIPGSTDLRRLPLVDPPPESCVWGLEQSVPRAWVVHRVEVLPPVARADLSHLARRTHEVFWPGGSPRDLQRSAVLEVDAESLDPCAKRILDVLTTGGDRDTLDSARCTITYYTANRVELDVTLHAPGLVVLNEQYFPGWRLRVATVGPDGGQRTATAPIFRANRFMRGALLAEGEYRLIFIYNPQSFLLGSGISLAGWTILLIATAWHASARRGRRAREVRRGQSPSNPLNETAMSPLAAAPRRDA